jgi:hypothetical protein
VHGPLTCGHALALTNPTPSHGLKCRAVWARQPVYGNQTRKGNSEIKPDQRRSVPANLASNRVHTHYRQYGITDHNFGFRLTFIRVIGYCWMGKFTEKKIVP